MKFVMQSKQNDINKFTKHKKLKKICFPIHMLRYNTVCHYRINRNDISVINVYATPFIQMIVFAFKT